MKQGLFRWDGVFCFFKRDGVNKARQGKEETQQARNIKQPPTSSPPQKKGNHKSKTGHLLRPGTLSSPGMSWSDFRNSALPLEGGEKVILKGMSVPFASPAFRSHPTKSSCVSWLRVQPGEMLFSWGGGSTSRQARKLKNGGSFCYNRISLYKRQDLVN